MTVLRLSSRLRVVMTTAPASMAAFFMEQTVRRGPYWWLVAGAAAWVTAILVAPVAAHEGWVVSAWIYEIFHRACHQLEERSFHLLGHPLAVCHRCFGLYLGGLIGLVVWPSADGLRRRLLERPRLVPLFVVPLLVDVALIPNTAATRFTTGVLAALPAALLVWAAADQIFSVQLRSRGEHGPA